MTHGKTERHPKASDNLSAPHAGRVDFCLGWASGHRRPTSECLIIIIAKRRSRCIVLSRTLCASM
eukprot:474913-Pyramimonas_sp.AAC.1